MAIKKSDLYSSLWDSCNELRGGMDASQYKDYILVLLFLKYVSDKAKADPDSIIDVPEGASFDDLLALAGSKDVGEGTNKIIAKLAEANDLEKVIDLADFDDENKLGKGKELQDRVSKLIRIFSDLDFGGSRAEGDDLLGDAYEYLMQHFATEAGKSKGQFYTPAEVSRILAKLLGIGANTRRDQTAYDPTCGSGSLLLKVADEAPRSLTLYGQEKDNATWALAKMNMVLHGNEDAILEPGDTITSPKFVKDGKLVTFDFAVANPPFSLKSWNNGLENAFGRFEYGMPPDKNGDYAFLLHVLTSLKSNGKAAVILPHGVLFRGNAEGRIRKELVQRGYVKAVIGLPPNLFYGTGIPACIVVLDKENAAARTGVLFIDASKGYIKDGAKNRLRNRDMHQIVDVFINLLEVPGYSRIVLRSEIAGLANDFNLNISRYVDSSGAEDLHDLDAHINGGIPNRDIDALAPYWDAAPSLRDQLFAEGRPGYSTATVEPADVAGVLRQSPELQTFGHTVGQTLGGWLAAHRASFQSIDVETRPNDLIETASEDLLDRFRPLPVIEEYAVYEQLMTYWHSVMHDDVYMVMLDGWTSAAQPRPVRQIGADKNGRPKFEAPSLTVGSNKLVMDLLPPALVVTRFLAAEKAEVE